VTVALERDADFTAWFDEILPRVFRLASRTAASRAEAEDLASEALARAYAKWPSIRGLPHRDGWVLRTTANLGVDAARHDSRFPWSRLRAQRAEAAAPSVEDQVADRRIVAAALSRLPARQREAVSLRYLAGMTLEETATTMGLGVETVRTHVARGLSAMRSALGNESWEGSHARD
jgi:RNA polymerase sigma factor (sigma-70 family)